MLIKGGINHITLRVQNLKRSEAFYSDILGLKKVGSRTGMDFYSSGHYNHELALVEDTFYKGSHSSELLHFAFNLESEADLASLRETLQHENYAVSEGISHIIARSFYTQDPDGYSIELTVDQPSKEWINNSVAFKKDYLWDAFGA